MNSIASIDRSFDIETHQDTLEAEWMLERDDGALFAMYSYDDEDELLQREYENRVFYSSNVAEQVKSELQASSIPVESEPEDRVVGSAEPHSINETISDIYKISKHIKSSLDSMKSSVKERLVSRCRACVSTATKLLAVTQVAQRTGAHEMMKEKLSELKQNVTDLVEYTFELVTSSSSDAKQTLFEIERPIQRLTQIVAQVDNWWVQRDSA